MRKLESEVASVTKAIDDLDILGDFLEVNIKASNMLLDKDVETRIWKRVKKQKKYQPFVMTERCFQKK